MTNPFAHDPDCDFWFDHYESECTCRRPGWKPPAADPAQVMRAMRDETAELRRRVEWLESQVAVMLPMIVQEEAQAMAELIREVMFREDNTPGYTSEGIAALNFELMEVLGNLKPGSDAYMARAKAFHDEVARR